MRFRPHLLVVRAPYYQDIIAELTRGATLALDAADATYEIIDVPGAFEIPAAIAMAEASDIKTYDGYLALGCVIRGETTHYETVCNDSSRALTLLGLEGLCIGNGILTVENIEQAEARADPARLNKGGGAAEACLHLVALARRFAPEDRA